MLFSVWEGRGYLVPAFIFFSSLLMELGIEAWLNDSAFYQTQLWPLAFSLTISGIACRMAGTRLNGRTDTHPNAGPGVIVDGQKSEPAKPSVLSTFFFIRVENWIYPLGVIALGLLLMQYVLPAIP